MNETSQMPANVQAFINTLPAEKQAEATKIVWLAHEDASTSHHEWIFYNSNGRVFDLDEADRVGWVEALSTLKEWVAMYQTLESL